MGKDANNQPINDGGDGLNMSLPESRSEGLMMITKAYLSQLDPDVITSSDEIVNDLMGMVKHAFVLYNETAENGTKWRIPTDLEPEQIAMIILHVHNIKNINCSGAKADKDYDILGIYQEAGENAGIYVSDEATFRNLIWEYNPSLKKKDIEEVLYRFKNTAERIERCNDRDLIALNNGIFNYRTKQLEPFSPDKVFTAKCRVNYNPTAVSPVIHNDKDNTDWEVEDWVKGLFEDGSDIPETIWEIMGAIIRPNVRWNKAAWFVSEKGNNGKGTLCQLFRNLAGKGSYASIPLADFGKDFMLEPLIRCTSIITDENDVGTFIDKAANLKAVITNDVIQVNRKFKKPIAYQFRGFMVQCVNEMPRVKDKSESFYRRQLFIPFKKCYTGMERRYIKDDYLNRPEVLEYVLYRILNMNYYELSEPEACKQALEEYKTYNDPVRDFLQELLSEVKWECIPSPILYDMFKGWSQKNNPRGSILGKSSFFQSVGNCIDPLKDGWEFNKNKKNRVLYRMDCEEPLLDEFSCERWMINPKSKKISDRINTSKKWQSTVGLFKL